MEGGSEGWVSFNNNNKLQGIIKDKKNQFAETEQASIRTRLGYGRDVGIMKSGN